jgi:hypothetical protein
MKPEAFRDLFEFTRFVKTTGVFKEIAMKRAGAAYGR